VKSTYYRIYLLLFFILASLQTAMATHNRAGEITFRQISQYKFEIKLTTYTDSRSVPADRSSVDIDWGDSTNDTVPRDPGYPILVAPFTYKNVYTYIHQYATPGQFTIRFTDPNRVANIINIENSVSVPFYLESLLIIDPLQGFNQSPILLQPPIDVACAGHIFIHNPNAYDPDGDSLVFSLIPPEKSQGKAVPGYTTPQATHSFTINRSTGEVVWDSPKSLGIYNIAILVEEYRHGKRIGYIIRDMQISVVACNDNPPYLKPLKDTCVVAGTNLRLSVPVQGGDSDNKVLELTATGGPFLQKIKKAFMTPDPAHGTKTVQATFQWDIDCAHIRRQPYRVVFRIADDDPLNQRSALQHMDIKVVGPAPQNLTTKAFGNSITLKWQKPICANVVGYLVYRRIDSSRWNHNYCETGIPGYVGFQLIDTIVNGDTLTYKDDDHGNGLSPGLDYCYRLTALYLNAGQFEFAESYASNEACAKLKKDIPVITHVSVLKTGVTDGKIFVDWSAPTALDTSQNPGPYTYKLYRSEGLSGASFNQIASFTANTLSGLKDTTFTDSMLNTAAKGYSYKVEFYNTIDGKPFYIGKTATASSVYLNIRRAHQKLQLSWAPNVPWRNTAYVVYKKNSVTSVWDSIGTTSQRYFTDTGLINGTTYCYYVKSIGSFFSSGFTDPLINFSQEHCESPRDTIPPCAPDLQAEANCDDRLSTLHWNITDSCTGDVTRYRIFFSPRNGNTFTLVDTVNGRSKSQYLDIRPELRHSLAGCYRIVAVDSFDNVSPYSNEICVDNCPKYDLPNVFTPNGDDINDLYVPMPGYRFIESIELHVYNRWGQEVFNTTNPDINWDGVDAYSHRQLPDGVYYYICSVKEIYQDHYETRKLQGTISILR
jgi:gliding motility-associated-like protein